MTKRGILIITTALVILIGLGFVIGINCRYDRMEIAKCITVYDGMVLTPESFEKQTEEATWRIVGYHSAWKFPWETKTVYYYDGIYFQPDINPIRGLKGFSGTIYFAEGDYITRESLHGGFY